RFSRDWSSDVCSSDLEEDAIVEIMQNIKQEYHNNIDKFSLRIMISQIELLLNFSERFYNRQFITRQITNHQVLEKLENWLEDYFQSDQVTLRGLPTVQEVSKNHITQVNFLPTYFKVLTVQSTKNQ